MVEPWLNRGAIKQYGEVFLLDCVTMEGLMVLWFHLLIRALRLRTLRDPLLDFVNQGLIDRIHDGCVIDKSIFSGSFIFLLSYFIPGSKISCSVCHPLRKTISFAMKMIRSKSP